MRIAPSFVPLLIAIFLFSAVSSAQSTARKHLSLDTGWKFAFGHAAHPEKDFNYGIKNIFVKSGAAAGTAIDPKFNDNSWLNKSFKTSKK